MTTRIENEKLTRIRDARGRADEQGVAAPRPRHGPELEAGVSAPSEPNVCVKCGHSRGYKAHTAWRQTWDTEDEIPQWLRAHAHVYVPPNSEAEP